MYVKILDSCVFLNNFNVMQQKNYNVIGVMSGTSLDGIDLAYVKISQDINYRAHIHTAQTVAYDKHWQQMLAAAHTLPQKKLQDLNEQYTQLLASVIKNFINTHHISNIDAICSHGHTVLHQPHNGFTLQLGNLPKIAKLVGHKVVCDFRVQDVNLGGQGAPLVPVGDQLLFPQYEYCLNLGGFANVSLQRENKRVAYDICAVNTVLNRYAQQLGRAYDDKGAFAKAGTIHPKLLAQINALPFFAKLPPKSLGIEWVHERIVPIIESYNLAPKDVIATFTEHVVLMLRDEFKEGSRVLVTGGGAYNEYLLERLRIDTTIQYVLPDPLLIEYKEALIFALLGILKMQGKVNTLSSVTGAQKNHSAGEIYLP